MISREEIVDWLEQEDYLEAMKQYIKIPSVSARTDEVKKATIAAIKILEDLGFETTSYPTSGNDIILGKRVSDEQKPSILIYGHYDVQSEGDLDLWDSPPYEPEVRGTKLFGRGSADNKGQHYAHFLALKFLKERYPELLEKINIKFILDGDEETGSFSLPEVMKEHRDQFDADFVYVSDGPSLSYTQPSIVASVRGILAFQITISYNTSDLHSGNFGGLARSATRDLLNLIDSMVDPNGKILINGYYDSITPATERENEALEQLTSRYDSVIKEAEIIRARTFDQRSNYELVALFSTFNINGIQAGAVGKESRTIIPQKATVSIDSRLVPNQIPKRQEELIAKHIEAWRVENKVPEEALRVEFEHSMGSIQSSFGTPYFDMAVDAARSGFEIEPIQVPRLGGSLPIYLFDEYLGKPVILVPYALPDEKNHAPNENLDLPFFESGVATTVQLLASLANKRIME